MNTLEGYSATPLVAKLGIKEGTTVHVVHSPAEYADLLGPLPLEASIKPGKPMERVDFIHLFVTRKDELRRELVSLVDVLRPHGTIWISWPKKASGFATDLTEDTLREVCLPLGLVDVKVCAVSQVWSGLKFVWRKEVRPTVAG
ncbi:MAG TPA: DUF3052 domain-containing protein [Verrucomicrobiae bacterium]|nr:DUF3052 domain-containing protein [Verrucomicrobiae bacterium]